MASDSGVGIDTLKAFLKENPDFKVYDFSSVELADQCLRKYKYRYIDHVEDKTGIEAAFSNYIIHPALGASYEKPYSEFVKQCADAKWWQPLWKNFQNSGVRPVTSKQERAYRLEVAQRIIRVFSDSYPSEFELYKLIGVELVYWRVLPGLKNAVWVAKPDLMITRRVDDLPMSGEIKVSTWDFNRNLNVMDRQILSQAWATGVKWQMKIFCQIVMDRNEFYEVRINREIKQPEDSLMAEWLDEIQFSVGVLQDAAASDIWPKRAPRSCHDFNKPCAFIDICPLGNAKDLILDNMPKSNPWKYLGL